MWYWIILAVIIIACVVCVMGNCVNDRWNRDGWEIGMIFSFILLILWMVITIATQCESRSFLVQIEAKRQTINNARDRGAVIENAALTVEIAKVNAELAHGKWMNEYFDGFVCDRIEDVKPITMEVK